MGSRSFWGALAGRISPVISSQSDGARDEVAPLSLNSGRDYAVFAYGVRGVLVRLLPLKHSADCTLGVLQLARFNAKIGRKRHERSRNGGAF
jgi:hypothetical protein